MLELFGKLGINGKLLIFQVVNFLILLFILKKFLYKPLVKFLDARQKKIADSLTKAENIDKEYQKIRDIEAQKLIEAEKKAVALIEDAKKSAKDQEKEILAAAGKKTEKLSEQARQEIAQEKLKMLDELKKETTRYAVLAAEKILERTFNPKDEEKLIKEALNLLEEHGK